MPDERVIQQVRGILDKNNIEFKTGATRGKQSFLVFNGSAAVVITFADWGESTIVGLLAILLQDVDSSGERKEKILEAVNEKNRTAPIGTFYFDPDRGYVVAGHRLLGDELREQELMSELSVFGSMADEADDELREAFGSGVRAIDAWNSNQGEAWGAKGRRAGG